MDTIKTETLSAILDAGCDWIDYIQLYNIDRIHCILSMEGTSIISHQDFIHNFGEAPLTAIRIAIILYTFLVTRAHDIPFASAETMVNDWMSL